MKTTRLRIEKDSLGEIEIPYEAYYGVQTQRAVHNFPVSGWKAHPVMVDAYVYIKKAAAMTNAELGLLNKKIAGAIVKAADEVLKGKYREHFVVDVYQAGAGTSHNMNTNEVLANRGVEILGGRRGDYKIINPNDHVNMAQSTNDTFPTAMRLASLIMAQRLMPVIKHFQKTLERKAKQFAKVIKSGRTHLQDAAPITLGQEFEGYAEIVARHYDLILASQKHLAELGIGGTAVGTGLNTHAKYRNLMAKNLSKVSGLKLRPTKNYFESMQSMMPFMELSSAINNFAIDMTKITNDLRLLASGPTTGFAEIIMPAVQPGSSIMPGKVNPSMAEMMNQVLYQVMGNNHTVMMCSQAGQLELNVMMPVMIFNIVWMIEILKNSLKAFDDKCVAGLIADEKKCRDYAEKSISIVTALNPIIGYARAAEIAKESVKTHRSIMDVIRSKNIMPEKELNKVLDLMKLTKPGL
ncbi:MAG TPA: aspartate ammonia-lyase [Ignavibacteria bacterium]|nr:aspartate ammonia-lyase [Bacteroidota bacterium]HRE09545.1 aspartate ammonia-lyase [Ignavibacteria bacterium]HRF64435.1 aspartate ammonia-lyase [Ignavibacteria bacterium]HRJ04114.1 aspartate ammonia-lyase [Ignavibacteria bacterium]